MDLTRINKKSELVADKLTKNQRRIASGFKSRNDLLLIGNAMLTVREMARIFGYKIITAPFTCLDDIKSPSWTSTIAGNPEKQHVVVFLLDKVDPKLANRLASTIKTHNGCSNMFTVCVYENPDNYAKTEIADYAIKIVLEPEEDSSEDIEQIIQKSLSDGSDVLVIVNDEENAEGVVGEILDNTEYEIRSAYACNPNDLGLKDSVTGEHIPPMWASDAIADSDTAFVLHLEHIQECTSSQLSVWKTFLKERKICGEYIGNVVVCAEYVMYPDEANPKTSQDSLQFFDTIIRDGKCIKRGDSSHAKKEQEARKRKEAEERARIEEAAKRNRIEEILLMLKKEQEARKRKAAEERARIEEAAKRNRMEEERRRNEEQTRRKEEARRRAAEIEAKRKAEEEKRLRMEAEAKRKHDEEERRRAEEKEEARRRAAKIEYEERKKKEEDERWSTIFAVGLSLIPCVGFFREGSLSGFLLIAIGGIGLPFALVLAYEANKDSKKVAFRVLWVALFYVILCIVGFFTLDNNKTESTSNSDNVKIENFDASMIQEQLTEKFGQEYDFTVKDIEHMYYKHSDEEEWPIISQIILKNIETQDKDSCYLAISCDGNLKIIDGLSNWELVDVQKEIDDILEELNAQNK